jgi:hypothetical protein
MFMYECLWYNEYYCILLWHLLLVYEITLFIDDWFYSGPLSCLIEYCVLFCLGQLFQAIDYSVYCGFPICVCLSVDGSCQLYIMTSKYFFLLFDIWIMNSLVLYCKRPGSKRFICCLLMNEKIKKSRKIFAVVCNLDIVHILRSDGTHYNK